MKLFYLTGMLLLTSIISAGQIKYIAHRGASYYAPENSLAAIRLAAELGADGAECDIQLTRDNQIVLWHDGNTERLTGSKDELLKRIPDERTGGKCNHNQPSNLAQGVNGNEEQNH